MNPFEIGDEVKVVGTSDEIWTVVAIDGGIIIIKRNGTRQSVFPYELEHVR